MIDRTKQIIEYRMELGLSQQDAAILIDVSRQTYIKYELDPDVMPLGKYERLINEFERLKELKN